MTTDRTEKNMKLLFNKMGAEKPSEDFTSLIMSKIEAENPYALSNAIPKYNYWFLLPYLITLLIAIPFIVPTINWIINIDWNFISLDISVIREWIGSFADSFAGITISMQTIIISLACTVLLIILSIEMFVKNRRIFN